MSAAFSYSSDLDLGRLRVVSKNDQNVVDKWCRVGEPLSKSCKALGFSLAPSPFVCECGLPKFPAEAQQNAWDGVKEE